MRRKKTMQVTEQKLLVRKRCIFEAWQDLECAKTARKAEADERKKSGDNKIRTRQPATSPFEEPLSYLKRSVYGMVRTCWRSDALDILRQCAMASGIKERLNTARHSAPEDTENPYYYGLILVTAGDLKFARHYRSRFPREMLFAHMHDVPHELLTGFLYQIGTSDNISRRLQNKTYESWCGKLPATDLAKRLRRKEHALAPAETITAKKLKA
jgi:hypothetical protein